jgi:hypothetical protein
MIGTSTMTAARSSSITTDRVIEYGYATTGAAFGRPLLWGGGAGGGADAARRIAWREVMEPKPRDINPSG